MHEPDAPAPLPQLRMEIAGLATVLSDPADGMAGPGLPGGYALRTFRPGDEDAWVALLQTGEFGHWDRERLDLMLANERAVVPHDGIFFVTHADRLVGTACTVLHADLDGAAGPDGVSDPDRVRAELGWVAVSPEHRGHGLGLAVCRAVLAFARQRGHDRAFLLTDDFRLPAIQTYFTLGFEPALVDQSHPSRWAAIHELLAARRRPA